MSIRPCGRPSRASKESRLPSLLSYSVFKEPLLRSRRIDAEHGPRCASCSPSIRRTTYNKLQPLIFQPLTAGSVSPVSASGQLLTGCLRCLFPRSVRPAGLAGCFRRGHRITDPRRGHSMIGSFLTPRMSPGRRLRRTRHHLHCTGFSPPIPGRGGLKPALRPSAGQNPIGCHTVFDSWKSKIAYGLCERRASSQPSFAPSK